MNMLFLDLFMFGIEVSLSVFLSFMVVSHLREVLEELLISACPNAGARFWVKTLALLQYLAPLLLVIWRSDLAHETNTILQLKHALVWMLLGHCIALLLLSRIIWKTLVVPAMNTPQDAP